MNQNEEIVSENSESAENVAASPETANGADEVQSNELQKTSGGNRWAER